MAENFRQNLRKRIRFLLEHAAPSARSVVCDVGANPVEDPPYHALRNLKACTVVGFEPQEEACKKLQDAAADNEVYVPVALGAPGPATLHMYKSTGFTSIFKLRQACLDWIGRVQRQPATMREAQINLRAMDDVGDIPAIDMLKIDVQGAELDIIRNGKTKLADAMAVITEIRYYQLYEDEPSWAELDTELRAQGFVLHKLLPTKQFVLPNSARERMNPAQCGSQMIDGDAVYVRNMENPDALSDDQLKHQALFAAAAFDSQDLAIRCLDWLAARKAVEPDVPRAYADMLPPTYFNTVAQAAE